MKRIIRFVWQFDLALALVLACSACSASRFRAGDSVNEDERALRQIHTENVLITKRELGEIIAHEQSLESQLQELELKLQAIKAVDTGKADPPPARHRKKRSTG